MVFNCTGVSVGDQALPLRAFQLILVPSACEGVQVDRFARERRLAFERPG